MVGLFHFLVLIVLDLVIELTSFTTTAFKLALRELKLLLNVCEHKKFLLEKNYRQIKIYLFIVEAKDSQYGCRKYVSC